MIAVSRRVLRKMTSVNSVLSAAKTRMSLLITTAPTKKPILSWDVNNRLGV